MTKQQYFVNIDGNRVEITDETEIARLESQYNEHKITQEEHEKYKYQRDRALEYPSLPEQLDMQYWDVINGTTTWQAAIDAVKAKYPKPTES